MFLPQNGNISSTNKGGGHLMPNLQIIWKSAILALNKEEGEGGIYQGGGGIYYE